MREYTPPELAAARKRRLGQSLAVMGLIALAGGLAGLVAGAVLDLVWLDFLADAAAPLVALAIIGGLVATVAGFNMVKSTRRRAE